MLISKKIDNSSVCFRESTSSSKNIYVISRENFLQKNFKFFDSNNQHIYLERLSVPRIKGYE
jgi:hypothetical protein